MEKRAWILMAALLLLAPMGSVGQVSFGWQPAHSYVYAVSGTQPNQYSENLQTAQVADSATGTAGIWYTFLTNGRDTAQTWACAFNPKAASVLGFTAGIIGPEWQAVGQFGDTLHIPLSLSFGDEFWFQTHPDSAPGNGYRGKVTGIHLTHTLGLPDTLLMIELQYHSTGLPAANMLNGSTFQTSSRFGLRSLPHLGYFPKTFRLMELVGENSQQLGVTDFGFYEIYNFQVGDVFHSEGHNFSTSWHCCDTIIGISYNGSLAQFTMNVRRWQHNSLETPIFDTINPGPPIGWDTTNSVWYGDTLIVYANSSELDAPFGHFNELNIGYGVLPAGGFFTPFNEIAPVKWGIHYFNSPGGSSQDSCWNQMIDQGIGYYAEGLGLVSMQYLGGYELLVFYHHTNGDSDGTAINPDDFTVSQPETAQALPITVFPNPAREYLIVRLPFDNQPATFTLRDTQGRTVREIGAQPGDTRLALNGLPTRLYIWQAVGADGRTATGRIVVQ